MANVVKDNVRIPAAAGAATSGVVIPSGGSFPVVSLSTREVPIIRHKVQIPGLQFHLTGASGGAADAQGQKILSLPAGKWLVLATDYDFTVTTQAGLSIATAVFALGTAAATADNAALTSTEANVCASQTLGDGTLAAAGTEIEGTTVLGTGTAPAIVGGTTDTDVYFNIGGTSTHASATDVVVTITGTVELLLIDTSFSS